MTILATIATRALAALGLTRATAPGPTRAASAVALDSAALTTATVAQVRAWIDAHDQGQFLQAALLADLALRDADLFGALSQRVLALHGLPLVTEPGLDTAAGRKLAAQVTEAWPRVAPRAVQHDLVASAVMLGFAVAQVVWTQAEDGYLSPRLEPWPSDAVEYRSWERRWYVSTSTGPLAITPGDGQWVLYTPRSERAPWLWGAIRCTAEWYLRGSYSAGDASRHSEVHGIPVWGAYLPSGGRETADGRAFVSSLRGMGRNAVVPLPQGSDKSTSYDLKLIEAQADAYRIFEFLLRTAGGKMRLAILGQDLTSQNAQVGTNASSNTGRSVTQDIIAADAETLGDCLRGQLLRPWARYLTGREDLAPWVYHDAKPKPDRAAEAATTKAAGEGIAVWSQALQGSGQAVDVPQLAARYGVPLVKAPEPEPPALPGVRRLASGDPEESAPGFVAGQAAADELAEHSTRAGQAALAPDLEVVLAAVEASTDFEDLRKRLASALRGMDPKALAAVTERAMILAELSGRWAVLEDL